VKAKARKTTNLVIGAMIAIAALATAFWMLALSPKRDEAAQLAGEVETLESSLAQHQAEVATAEAARQAFPTDYQRLVVLGKAVPGDDETASLLVQVNRIADRAGVRFESLQLEGGEGGEAPPPVEAGAAASPTEAAASLLPLGASIGPAGLAVMPYTLSFEGDFFKVADFIHGLDSLVKTTNEQVAVDGRLITVDSFSLAPSAAGGFPRLQVTFNVTTYLTPPGQGVGGGLSAPEPEEPSTLASASVGATP
jgi:Tfp pilus assembly protein PilO